MNRYFIETSVIVEYLRNNPTVIAYLDSLEGELHSSYVCLAELYEGVARVRNPATLESGIQHFFQGLSEVHGLTETIAKYFGLLRARLKKKGDIIEDLDLLIAATCVANNLVLITQNRRHFNRIEELNITSPQSSTLRVV